MPGMERIDLMTGMNPGREGGRQYKARPLPDDGALSAHVVPAGENGDLTIDVRGQKTSAAGWVSRHSPGLILQCLQSGNLKAGRTQRLL